VDTSTSHGDAGIGLEARAGGSSACWRYPPAPAGGDAAGVPTWRELGLNAVSSNWRAVVGPKGLPPAQIAYWDATFSAMVKTPEWLQTLQRNQWEHEYLGSGGTFKFMQEEYKQLEVLLTELGDAKK
jgi:putative tricarboxylic transport membrane protein